VFSCHGLFTNNFTFIAHCFGAKIQQKYKKTADHPFGQSATNQKNNKNEKIYH